MSQIDQGDRAPSETCPYCKQSNAADASKCMHCASAIQVWVQADETPGHAADSDPPPG